MREDPHATSESQNGERYARSGEGREHGPSWLPSLRPPIDHRHDELAAFGGRICARLLGRDWHREIMNSTGMLLMKQPPPNADVRPGVRIPLFSPHPHPARSGLSTGVRKPH